MTKEQKIEHLKRFELLITEWLGLTSGSLRDENAKRDKVVEMASSWGIVSEILRGLDYKLDVEVNDSNRGKNIKPQVGDIFHHGVFSARSTYEKHVNISTLHSYVLGAVPKINSGVIVRENVLPSVNLVISILNTFPEAVSRLKHRRKGKIAFEITDEYDVQDILYVMLKGSFSTLQYEDPTAKEGPTSARADFTISDLNTYIEVKFISGKGREAQIHDECLQDIQKYGAQDNCSKIIFFVYDPNKCIDNQYAYRSSLEKERSLEGKEIEVMILLVD